MKTTKTKKTMRELGRQRTSTTSRTAATVRKVTREKPKTAYDLCERVAQHIEEEPLRYHQGLWGFERFVIAELQQPQCGTVCCRAGWIVALHDGIGAEKSVGVAARSSQILGYRNEDLSEDSAVMSLYYDGSMGHLEQGTKKYAQMGASSLRKWMRKHAAHLKARKLADVPKLGKG